MVDVTKLEWGAARCGFGQQARVTFANGYGASILSPSKITFGDYELAVIGNDGRITYDTPITSDVERRASLAEIQELLDAIEAL